MGNRTYVDVKEVKKVNFKKDILTITFKRDDLLWNGEIEKIYFADKENNFIAGFDVYVY